GCKTIKLVKDGGDVTDVMRYLAKKVVHASNYGMGPKRLVEVVNEDSATTGIKLTLREATELMDRYFLLYPQIKENFWREVEQELRRSRTLNTPFNGRRDFFGRWDDKLLREAYSYIPQSTVGDLTRKAWVALAAKLAEQPQWDAVVLLNVHDSLLIQCLDDPQ